MPPYTFRVIFSGPCAYVPNRVEGGGQAASWSVILPNLRERWPGDADGLSIDPHLAVLQFDETAFHRLREVDGQGKEIDPPPPDVRLGRLDRRDNTYEESALYELEGMRITLDIPDAAPFRPASGVVLPLELKDRERILGLPDEKRRSLAWLPSLSWLRPQAAHFGRYDPAEYFDPGNDYYPNKARTAAHVVLTKGELATAEIDTQLTQNGRRPTIWEFRPYQDQAYQNARRQAVARKLMLEASILDDPVTVTIATGQNQRIRLQLKAARRSGVVTIEIKNRELEEIFRPGGREASVVEVDEDFRYLYSHAYSYEPDATDYLLPHLVEYQDAGNDSATCGGTGFSGFSKKLENAVRAW